MQCDRTRRGVTHSTGFVKTHPLSHKGTKAQKRFNLKAVPKKET